MNHIQTLAKAENLSKRYRTADGSVAGIDGVSLEIRAGEMVALVGPTGSGKTTLLMLLAGLEAPDGGSVELLDQRLETLSNDRLTDLRSHAVGIVYQQYNLFPGFNVRENIGLPLRLMLRPPYDADHRADELLQIYHEFKGEGAAARERRSVRMENLDIRG